MISSVSGYCDYFDGIRKRTLKYLRQIPPDQLAFTPHPGKFTLGDLIRHIAATEEMFTGAVLDGQWRYPGHSAEKGPSLEEAVAYLAACHQRAMERLRAASDELLSVKRPTLHGYPVAAHHLLMAMAEHEIHHRAQISQYLVALGIQPPQVFDLKIEQVPPDAPA